MSQFLGEIRLTPYEFPPHGWMFCDGSMLSVPQHVALFALLGTRYGGDGTKTFGIPDLRGRAILGPGQGPGLGKYTQGSKGGHEGVTIDVTTMAAHSHQVNVSAASATLTAPFGQFLAVAGPGVGNVYDFNAGATMHADTITSTGGAGAPHENRQPFLVLNYIIALEGLFPH